MRTLHRLLVAALVPTLSTAAALVLPGPAHAADQQQPVGDVRHVVLVGNNWEGTASVLAPRTFRTLGTVDVVPDREERMAEIHADPYRLVYFLAIRELIGEGHDQLVDDMYTSNDGRLLVVSRPSFADVVALDLRTHEIAWRFPVAGVRSDHMAMSPDGRHVAVSASTGKVVHVLEVATGREVGSFPSGGSPHENVYFADGTRILHASIGSVYTPLDDPALDATKDERVLQVVDARTFEVLRRYDVRAALDEAGLTEESSAVRPLTMSPDERRIWFQVSFFHGFLEMDLRSGRITRVTRLPDLVPELRREQYLLDSAHHGIAANPRGTRICVAGTMSDYATVVRTATMRRGRLLAGGEKPYWVTQSRDGRHCYISWSGSDTVSRISFRTGRLVDTVPVGDHPQRIRTGFVRRAWVTRLR